MTKGFLLQHQKSAWTLMPQDWVVAAHFKMGLDKFLEEKLLLIMIVNNSSIPCELPVIIQLGLVGTGC